MSEVETQEVHWLWHPYIPEGKLTIIQGNPGEGKTTLALWIAAMCSQGLALPDMDPTSPINIHYQTAEDGLGDTIKPRLMTAGTDLNRIICIDETEHSLSLLDERIEKAVKETNAKLMILDPLQGYLGRGVDMNRANEIRDVLKRLTIMADQTGCAVILIGHLNKAVGANSAYRGLGSMDFRAAARSVLLVGRMKKEPHIRVIVHDKSSLAPEGKSIAFSIEDGVLHWVDGYDKITAEDLLNGGPANSKVEQTEKLVREQLAKGPTPVKEIQKLVKQAGISSRTLDIAKKYARCGFKEGGWTLEMGVDKLKGVRAQRHLRCVLLFCILDIMAAYILCAARTQINKVCVLAFFHASGQPSDSHPLFRPCRPRGAHLWAR